MLWLNPESILICGPPFVTSPLPSRSAPRRGPLQGHAVHVGHPLAIKSLPHPREPLRVVRHEELDLPGPPGPAGLPPPPKEGGDPPRPPPGGDEEGARSPLPPPLS